MSVPQVVVDEEKARYQQEVLAAKEASGLPTIEGTEATMMPPDDVEALSQSKSSSRTTSRRQAVLPSSNVNINSLEEDPNASLKASLLAREQSW
jgi:hypothetical protein